GTDAISLVVDRPTTQGLEDYVVLERAPEERVRYAIDLDEHVAGLRLVRDTLELLDAGGAPRLRMRAPYVMGRDGVRHAVALALDGCSADRSLAAPWRRPVVPPGSQRCEVSLDFDAAAVAYPALVDPAWETTASLKKGRAGHTALELTVGDAAGMAVV